MKPSQLLLASGHSRGLNSFRLLLWVVAGVPLMLGSGSLAAWRTLAFWEHPYAWPWMLGLVVAFFSAAAISSRLRWLPLAEGVGVILLNTCLTFFAVVLLAALSRSFYSRSFFAGSLILSAVWLPLAYNLSSRTLRIALALVPGGMADDLAQWGGIEWHILDKPVLNGACQGVVVDWHQKLDDVWIRLLSDCSLKRIPVYHAAVVYEAASGRVSLEHMSEWLLEGFRVHPIYSFFKRVVDLAIVLFSLPLVVPVAVVVALAVRTDSPGPALFWQERVGRGGKVFRMYKFRSMTNYPGESQARFADRRDRRITRMGRIIRTFRLDELPQFWNVFRGEMSLIGPRPEQVPLAQSFERDIPFYAYRHLLKPGITGWAQVNRGYTAGVDETREKLQYDLYYIKYLSFWLDVLTVFKTLRTVLTGFGAR